MTIVESPPEMPEVDGAQLLFEEAKRRRRRRWLVSGIVALVLVGALGITLSAMASNNGGSSLPPVGSPSSAGPVAGSASNFSVRPVLCYAPPFTPTAGQSAPTGALPGCAPSSALTAANLQVGPTANSANGYAINSKVPADSQFGSFPSTSPSNDNGENTVLLPGPSPSQNRYVLGPAGLTGAQVKSASAQKLDGQWIVNVVLTGNGAADWDSMARQQFHAMIGIDVDGKVISAPITQPTQAAFSSFGGQMQISGLSGPQAKALAGRF